MSSAPETLAARRSASGPSETSLHATVACNVMLASAFLSDLVHSVYLLYISIRMFLLGSGRLARAFRGAGGGALEITATACSEPPVRSKSLLQPARSRLCARNRCSSLLGAACALEITGSSLFGAASALEIAVRRCWALLHFALHYLTLFFFAPCMYMHGSTLVLYIFIYTFVGSQCFLYKVSRFSEWDRP